MQTGLIDKLCERLAVETAGVALYQAVLDKLSPQIESDALATRLRRFQADEARHRDLLIEYLDKLGVPGDQRETPSARLADHEGQAFLKLVGEAETPAQILNVLLTVELMDENAWELLVDLARDAGDEESVRLFDQCLREEKEHLIKVRGALVRMIRDDLSRPAEV
jgi:rubrerythrin